MAHDVFLSHSSKNKTVADAVCATLESHGIRCWVAPRDIPAGANWGESIIDAITGSEVMVVILSSHSNSSQQVMREVERAVSKGVAILPLRMEDIPLSKSLEYFLSTAHWLDAFTPHQHDYLEILADRVGHMISGSTDAPATQTPPAPEQPEQVAEEPVPPVPEPVPELEPTGPQQPAAVVVQPVPASETRPGQRRWWLVGSLAVVGILVLLLIGWKLNTGQVAEKAGEEQDSSEVTTADKRDTGTTPSGQPPVTGQTPGAEMSPVEKAAAEKSAGETVLVFGGRARTLHSVAFSPDGKRIVSGGENGAAIWNAETGQLVRTLKDAGHAVSVAFSPDGKRIVGGGYDARVKIWDAETGMLMFTLKGHSNKVLSVAFSPDGLWVVSSSQDTYVMVWDVGTGERMHILNGHTSSTVHSVAFSPDGKWIASGSSRGLIKVWNVKTLPKNGPAYAVRTLRGHEKTITSLSFSPDSTRIASGSGDRTAKVWDTVTGQLVGTFRGHDYGVNSVAFSPDGKRVVSGSGKGGAGGAAIWNAETCQELLTLKEPGSGIFVSVAFSPDGRRIVSCGGLGGKVKIWDVAILLAGKSAPEITPAERTAALEASTAEAVMTLDAEGADVTSVACSPDGKWIASGSEDRTAKIWDAATGQQVRTLKGHDSRVWSVAFSPDGKRIASSSHDSTVKIWDSETGSELVTLKGYSGFVYCVIFSPDGSRLASCGVGKTVKIWDVRTGQELTTLEGQSERVYGVSFNPDGKQIVSTTMKVWNVETGESVATLNRHADRVTSVVFSPDGKWIVSGSRDMTVKTWDAKTGRETLALSTSAWVNSVALSLDGKWIAGGLSNGTFNVWNSKTGQLVLTRIKGHSEDINSVVFSPDGSRIVTGSSDNTVKIWDVTPLTTGVGN